MPSRRPPAPAPDPPRLVSGPEETYPGSDYSDEEREFLVAMERYKRQNRRPYPTWREVLHVVHSLGYRRVAEPRAPRPPGPVSPSQGEGA